MLDDDVYYPVSRLTNDVQRARVAGSGDHYSFFATRVAMHDSL